MLRIKLVAAAAIVGAVALLGSGLSAEATGRHDGERTYKVTLINLTHGQPFSPPVAATHSNGVSLFDVGRHASDEIAAIAQDGNQIPAVNALTGAPGVTEVVDVGAPLTPFGRTVGDFNFVSLRVSGLRRCDRDRARRRRRW